MLPGDESGWGVMWGRRERLGEMGLGLRGGEPGFRRAMEGFAGHKVCEVGSEELRVGEGRRGWDFSGGVWVLCAKV